MRMTGQRARCDHGFAIPKQFLIFAGCLLFTMASMAEERLDALRERAPNDKEAVLQLRRRLEPLADAGDVKAMIELADWYHYLIPEGWVTESDKQKAFELYLQAAEKGSAMGM